MDKSLPKQSVIYISHAGYNPLYIAIHPKWIRTDLLCGKPQEKLWKHFILWQAVAFHFYKTQKQEFCNKLQIHLQKTTLVIKVTTTNVLSSHVPIFGRHCRGVLPIPSFIKQS